MQTECKCCKRKLFFDHSIASDNARLYYDLKKKSQIAQQIKDDWVGINKSGKIYCRICLKSKRVCFKFDLF
jgi:hypothetical protein